MTYTFNSDILLGEQDRAEARREFPNIAYSLEHETLCEVFAPVDDRANTSKTRSRRWGVFAVLLATAALMLAAGEMLYHDLPKTQVRIIAAIGGVAGIVSVIIGVYGVMFKEKKMRWLRDRLSTERMRQFHFQHYAAHAVEILAGAKDPTRMDAYLSKREKDFEAFKNHYLNNADDHLMHMVEAEGVHEELMVEFIDKDIDPGDPHLSEYLTAYERLRFDRQIGYCNYVLRNKEGFWQSAPVRLAHWLETIGLSCVFIILVLHALVFMGAIANIPWMKGPMIHVLAIFAAIIALSARTFEAGFQPEREIERMRQYRLSLTRIHDRFKAAPTPREKIWAMRDLEKLAHEEMVLFLRGNYEAKFVM